MEDVTIPDGTVVAPEVEIVKAWKVKNTGVTAWAEGCVMKMQTGRCGVAPFEGNPEQLNARVPPLAAGEEYVVEVKLQMPSEPGRHVAYWRMCDPSGNGFGHRFWVDVVVADDVCVDEYEARHVLKDKEATKSVTVEAVEADDVTVEADDGVLVDLTNTDSESDDSLVDVGTSVTIEESSQCGVQWRMPTENEVQVRVEAAVEDVVGELYEDALSMLETMGFGNREHNRATLSQWSGNLAEAVNSLLLDA